MSDRLYNKEKAIEMAQRALDIFKESGIDATYTINIMETHDGEHDGEYFTSVFINAGNGETCGTIYLDKDEYGDLEERVEAIRKEQKKETDTEFAQRVFTDGYNPMDDIDRLFDIVKGWKEGKNE